LARRPGDRRKETKKKTSNSQTTEKKRNEETHKKKKKQKTNQKKTHRGRDREKGTINAARPRVSKRKRRRAMIKERGKGPQ